MFVTYMLLALGAGVAATAALPSWSWDTIQTYVRSKPPLATDNLLENTGWGAPNLPEGPEGGRDGGGESEHSISVLSGRHPATVYLC